MVHPLLPRGHGNRERLTPDGALWSVTDTAPGSPERVHRIDQWGVSDHSAALPASPRNGAALTATGPITAASDGSLWFVATDGGADFVVHYTPSAIPQESIWTGSAGDGKWSNASNWMSGVVPHSGSVVVLRGSGAMTDGLPVSPEREGELGLVVLTADNTYTGPTGVLSGPLRVDGDQPSSAITVEQFGVLIGGGTTGSVVVNEFGAIDFADEPVFFGHCPQTLTIDGNLVFDSDSNYDTAVEACGTPKAQSIGTVLVTGSVTLARLGSATRVSRPATCSSY